MKRTKAALVPTKNTVWRQLLARDTRLAGTARRAV
jgi:hypothetical protein